MVIVGGTGSNPWDLFLKRTTCVTKTQSKNIINDFLVFTHGKLPRSSITYNFQVKCAIFKKRRKRRFQKKDYIHWINIAADSRLIQTYLPDKCGEQYIVVQNTVPDKDNMSLSKPIYPYGDVMRRVTTGAGFDMIMGKIGSTPT